MRDAGVAERRERSALIPISPNTLSSASQPVSFTVPGNPLSLNHAYPTSRTGRRFHSPEGKRRAQAVALIAKVAMRGQAPFAGPVGVSLVLHFASRRPDLDNGIKPLLDSLAGICYANDRQVVVLNVVKGLDAENPRAEVSVWAVEP